MISETTRSRNPAGHAGLLENLLAIASALTKFFESRFALIAQESKAALVQLLVLASCLILALTLFAFGYGFLIASLVGGLAHIARISWLWMALGVHCLHFVIVGLFVPGGRKRMRKLLVCVPAFCLNKCDRTL